MAVHQINISESRQLKIQKYEYIKTGISELDKYNGLTTKDFLVVAGGTGSGKSTVALFMACTMAKAGHEILYINFEMDPQFVVKSISSDLGFNFEKDFGIKSNGFTRLQILSPDKKGMTFEAIIKAVQLIKPKVLFIDLFKGLVENLDKNVQFSKAQEYAKELSFFPQMYNCAVVTTEQLVKDSKVVRPSYNDIQGTSAVAQKATRILTIFRYSKSKANQAIRENSLPESYNEELMESTTEIIVCKDRIGEWRDGIKLVKLHKGIGFIGLGFYETQAYQEIAFKAASKW